MPTPKLYLPGSLSTGPAALAQQLDYPSQPVPFTQVKLTDTFWLPCLKTNTNATIPASLARCESANRVKNFGMAAAKEGQLAAAFPFSGTHSCKTTKGASYSLVLAPGKQPDEYVDGLIRKVGTAQEPDGYLYPARTIGPAHPHAWAKGTLGKGARTQPRALQLGPLLQSSCGPLPGHRQAHAARHCP